MLEHRDLAHRGCQYGGVRERGDLVSEVGPRDDGSGNHSVAESQCLPDAQQGHSDRGDCGPGTSYHNGDQGADDAGGQEKNLGTDDLDSVVDECRNYSAHCPRPGDRSDEEKDDDGCRHIADVAFDRLLEILPRDLEQPHRQPDGHTGREKQGNLARPEDGVAAEYADVQR